MRAMAAARPAMTAQTQRLALLYMAAAAALWAMVEGMGALLGSDQHPVEVVWMRYATHLALLLIVFGPRRGARVVQTARPRLQVSRGLLMLLMPICFLAAVVASEPETALSVFWIAPILTMLLSVWMLEEHVAPTHWLLAAGGWIGAVMLFRPGLSGLALALLPALGMAGSFSLYLVMTRMLRDESTLTNLIYTAACVLVPLSAIAPFFWHRPSARSLAIMCAIGLLGLGVLFGFDRATELAPVSVVAPMLYIQPLWAFGLAVAFDEATLGRAALLGAALILTSSATLLLASRRGIVITPPDAALAAEQPASVQP